MDYTRLSRRLSSQIGRLSGELSSGLPKVCGRFLAQMLYGIQASGSVLLTEIGRSLEEEISLKKTEERLCRQLSRPGLDLSLQEQLLRKAAKHLDDDVLLVFDPTDICKPYGRAMEHLCRVHDGSTGEIRTGYPVLMVIGAWPNRDEIVPLYGRLYSTVVDGFVSENQEWKACMEQVARCTGRRGLWVIDRGGDRHKLLLWMLKNNHRFLIRQRGDRTVLYRGKPVIMNDLARSCKPLCGRSITRFKEGKTLHYDLTIGFRRIALPQAPHTPLTLLVIRGLGSQPLLLLTNEPVQRSKKSLMHLLDCYLRRWSIEETIRYLKQSYQLENVRVLRYRSLQNLLPILMAVAYFTACVLTGSERLKILASYTLRAAKRVFGIPNFRYYAAADGIRAVFARSPRNPTCNTRPPPGALQQLALPI